MGSKSVLSFGPKKFLRFAKEKKEKIPYEDDLEYFCNCEKIEIKSVKAKPKKSIEPKPVHTKTKEIIEPKPVHTKPKQIIEPKPVHTKPKPIIDPKPVHTKPKQVIAVKPVQTSPKKPIEIKPIQTEPKQIKTYLRWCYCGQVSKDHLDDNYYVKKELKEKPILKPKPIKKAEKKPVKKEEKKVTVKPVKPPKKEEEQKAEKKREKSTKKKEKSKPYKPVKTQVNFPFSCRYCIRWFKSLNKAFSTKPKFTRKKHKPQDLDYRPRIYNQRAKATKRAKKPVRVVKKQEKTQSSNLNIKMKTQKTERIETAASIAPNIVQKQKKSPEDFNPRILKYKIKAKRMEQTVDALPSKVIKQENPKRLDRTLETSAMLTKNPDKPQINNPIDYGPRIFLNYKTKPKQHKYHDVNTIKTSETQKRKSHLQQIVDTFNLRTSYDLRASTLKPLSQNNKRKSQKRLKSGDASEQIMQQKLHHHKIPLRESHEKFPNKNYSSKSSNKVTQTIDNKKVSFKSNESFNKLPSFQKILKPLLKNSLKDFKISETKTNSCDIENLIKAYLEKPNSYRKSKSNNIKYYNNFKRPEQSLDNIKAETFAIYKEDIKSPTNYNRY